MKRRVIRWGIILAMSSVVGLLSWTLIHSYIFHPISGTSMTPTVTDGSVVLLKKSEDVKRFDLIGFAIAGESDRFVKRIIGLPEDPVFISGTRLVIDLEGEGRFVNTYSVDLTDSIAQDWRELTRIPKNCYFVLGDNLQVSKDSRSFGWVNTESVEGRVQWIQNK
ncbi:signal peptidase I [Enterococcus sp. JM4C]|nr:signal peptidase I [Enterococcus sp. JM4C]